MNLHGSMKKTQISYIVFSVALDGFEVVALGTSFIGKLDSVNFRD